MSKEQLVDLSSAGLRVLRISGRRIGDDATWLNGWEFLVGQQEEEDGGIVLRLDARLWEDVLLCIREIDQLDLDARKVTIHVGDLRKKKKAKK